MDFWIERPVSQLAMPAFRRQGLKNSFHRPGPFPSLWRKTREFTNVFPDLLHPKADFDELLDPSNGGEYNNC
jgi:hypothetical protein